MRYSVLFKSLTHFVTNFLDFDAAISNIACGVDETSVNKVTLDDKIYEVVTQQVGVECKYVQCGRQFVSRCHLSCVLAVTGSLCLDVICHGCWQSQAVCV